MDTNRINKLYDLIHKLIERKESVLEKYKSSNSYFIISIQSEITLLRKIIEIINELVEEIKEQNQLQKRIYELEEELQTSNRCNEILSEKIFQKHQTAIAEESTIKRLKQWKQRKMQSTNN